jgi:hypothetical protein
MCATGTLYVFIPNIAEAKDNNNNNNNNNNNEFTV